MRNESVRLKIPLGVVLLGVCLLAYHQYYSSDDLENPASNGITEISIEHQNNIDQIQPIKTTITTSTQKSIPEGRSKCEKNCPNGSCFFRYDQNGSQKEDCDCNEGFKMNSQTDQCEAICDRECKNGKCQVIYDWFGKPRGKV